MKPSQPIPLSPRKLLLDALHRLDARDVQRALNLGADPLAVSRKGETPLLSLVHSSGPTECPSTPERMACLHALLPVSQLDFTFTRHSMSPSLLAAAIYSAPAADVALVHALLDAGARDGANCCTPALVMSASTRRMDFAHELLSRGFDPAVRDELGRDALMCAALRGNIPLVELLASRCDVLATDKSGKSAADHAGRNTTSHGHAIFRLISDLRFSARESLAISATTPLAPISAHTARL